MDERPATKDLFLDRVRRMDEPPPTAAIEAAIREQVAEVIQGSDLLDQLRADAINAILRAKGVQANLLLTPYEAAKVFSILSHLEELSGFSG